jgi:ParB/Sulfiredoxin domain
MHQRNTTMNDRYLPPLSNLEYQALKADIEANGVLVPVVVDEYGNVIDGFHRTEIATDLGITDYPSRVVFGLTEEQKRHTATGVTAAGQVKYQPARATTTATASRPRQSRLTIR